MKVIVTSGPSYEPIDRVRRLTNFSTGELGVHLSNQLVRAGFEVFGLKRVYRQPRCSHKIDPALSYRAYRP